MRNPSIMQQIKGLKLSYVQEKFEYKLSNFNLLRLKSTFKTSHVKYFTEPKVTLFFR